MVVRDVDPACKDCAGVNKTDGPSYCCENSRLGPSVLPTKPPFPVLLEGYKRFGNLTARQFVNNTTWFNQTSNTYVYPYADGFQNDTSMVPIKGMEILTTGMRVDHFGGLNILAPSVTAFSQRSLPPSCLNNIDNNYNQYEVAKSFTVLSGPVTGNMSLKGYLYFERNALNSFAQPGLRNRGRVYSICS